MIGIYAWLAAVHWGRVGTWALAIGTLLLAFFTWRVSRTAIKTLEQNNKILESEERHHQENLRPICVFERDEKLSLVIAGRNYVKLGGSIVNKGYGAAIDCVLYLISPSKKCYISIALPTIGRDERVPKGFHDRFDLESNYLLFIYGYDETSAEIIENSFNKGELVFFIKYKDIFENWLITKQQMNSIILGGLEEHKSIFEGLIPCGPLDREIKTVNTAITPPTPQPAQ